MVKSSLVLTACAATEPLCISLSHVAWQGRAMRTQASVRLHKERGCAGVSTCVCSHCGLL
uniref:Uncharacterized protein n=1 Tax=Anguilla anguilla TaxID=7936 RepID=A0A0E9R218_ANGAN